MKLQVPNRERQLHRAEEARRQVQRQLGLIDRQIQRSMAALIPQLHPRPLRRGRNEAANPKAFLERYRAHLAALTAERQPEIDALSRKLARQDRALAELRLRCSDLNQARPEGSRLARTAISISHSSARGVLNRSAPEPDWVRPCDDPHRK